VQVVGLLDAWVLSDKGWYAACCYRVKLGQGHFVDQEHLVPARVVKRASGQELELGRMRGEIV